MQNVVRDYLIDKTIDIKERADKTIVMNKGKTFIEPILYQPSDILEDKDEEQLNSSISPTELLSLNISPIKNCSSSQSKFDNSVFVANESLSIVEIISKLRDFNLKHFNDSF